jgi:hypothetical protein
VKYLLIVSNPPLLTDLQDLPEARVLAQEIMRNMEATLKK